MSRSRQRRKKLPAGPVLIEIESLNHEGRGVGHIGDRSALVDGALASELVSAAYTGRRSQFDELKTLKVERASADRIEPACRFFPICGGCSLQHWRPSAQLDFKQALLLEQLQHAAGIDAKTIQLLPQLAGECHHYRRKARLAVRLVFRKGGALVGFREKHGSFITEMDDCQILVSEVACLIAPLRELITGLQGGSTIPQIEVAAGEADAAASKLRVALVVRHLAGFSSADLEALRSFAEHHALDLYLQPAGIDSVYKLYPGGSIERLHYFLPEFDLRFDFHPMDFIQINAGINRQVVSRTVELLQLDSNDRVLDMFCGFGNFTLPIATRCGEVVGVEGSDVMVSRGEENAALNRIRNAGFYAANLSKTIEGQLWSKQAYDKILLDPPRSGAIEIMPWIARSGARKIIYVSCNPVTLARDSVILIKQGYRLKSAGVMDMFPHTTHVESMAEFELWR